MLCERICGSCQVPSGVGLDFCGQAISRASVLPAREPATEEAPSRTQLLRAARLLCAAGCVAAAAVAALAARKVRLEKRGEVETLWLAVDAEDVPSCSDHAA